MANAFYEKSMQKFGLGTLSWTSGGTDLRCAAILATHTEDLVNDEFWSDISADVVGSPVEITNPSVASDGVFDGDDITFATLSGSEVGSLVIYRNTGTPSTSSLIMWIDDMSGLPFTPNGTDVNVAWNNGSDKIARL